MALWDSWRYAKGKPASGTVHLRAFHQGGNIVIEIKDDGAGLNKERLVAKAIEKGLIAPDQTPFDWLRGRPRAPQGEVWDKAVAYWRTLPTDEGATYDNTVVLDANDRIVSKQALFEQAFALARAEGRRLVIFAGKEYGTGSSRDWAAKGTALLGVKAVIAESYERIHRSNLIGMGVIPLQFPEGESAESLGLTGEETFSITGVTELNNGSTPRTVKVKADDVEFDAVVRIDTPGEANYYRNGGIMQYVLRNLLRG